MSYLLDKKIKQKRFYKIVLCIIFLGILFYFRVGLLKRFSFLAQTIFRPVLVVGNKTNEKIKNISSYFAFKNSLYKENQSLKDKLAFDEARMTNYDSTVAENNSMKETLGRKNTNIDMTLAAILYKPNQSIYDTLIIDAGEKEGIKIGDVVFAYGNIPIGRISMVYANSSKVILFSSAGEKTQAVISLGHSSTGEAGKDVFMEIIGRGGGNFEMLLPRGLTLQKGDQVVMPGIHPYVLAIAQTIISDPRDPFTKALLTAPVNLWELKFVQVTMK